MSPADAAVTAPGAPVRPLVSAAPETRLLHSIVTLLDRLDIPYCILHGYGAFGAGIATDVDCVLPARLLPDGLAAILAEHRGSLRAQLVQWLQHESTAHYLVLATDAGGTERHFLALDASSDYRRDGRVFYSGAELLASRRRTGGLWVPAPALEFGCYLVKKVAKGSLGANQGARLSELYRQDPVGAEAEVARFWPAEDVGLIVDGARAQRWDRVRERLPGLRAHLLRRRGLRAFPAGLRYWTAEAIRRFRRWRSPTGLHVVLLGPDGAGKSTVLPALGEALAPAFRRVVQRHLAPALLPRRRAGIPVDRPHILPPRGRMGSVAKAAYWALDYTVGYALLIRTALARSTLVLFDRYLLDALVDPRRYRYGGPRWLLPLLWQAVPKPDLVILLDAPTDVLQDRKREVPYEETRRQRELYRALVAKLPNGHIVDGSRPLERVAADASDIVVGFLAARAAVRLGVSRGASERAAGQRATG